ncbi:unnamed protein product [Gulo gulo]|uniref:Uncharacterized protein n=1 Tax=Gulo gulo TaxID=48420 RepID=A0A9X9PZA7_GULGU|nr:unnamed protein product [Gulo gulo]
MGSWGPFCLPAPCGAWRMNASQMLRLRRAQPCFGCCRRTRRSIGGAWRTGPAAWRRMCASC